MPMRLLRASKAHAGAHISANLRLWAGIFAALTAVGIWLYSTDFLGVGGGLWSHFLTLCAMVLGVLIISISHEGYQEPNAVQGASGPRE